MDEYKKIIESLKKDLESKEKDIYLAATYGKQLLCENDVLHRKQEELLSQIEILKQERHSLQSTVDAKTQMMKVHLAEIDSLKESFQSASHSYEQLKKENAVLTVNYQNSKKENCDLKKVQDELISNCNELKEQIESLESQVKDYEDQTVQSLNETFYSEEYQKMQSELHCLSEEKVKLELALHGTQFEVEQMKTKKAKYIKKIEELQEEVADKDKEIATYSVLIEKSKEEATDLRGEIEMLKLEQVDVKRRGNSIFGELDDRRLEVERGYIELRDKYLNREEQFMENLMTLRRTKNQLAAALASMSLRNVDVARVEELENHLDESKREIWDLTDRLIKAEKISQNATRLPIPDELPQKTHYDYLRALLQTSEKKVKSLEDDLSQVRRLKVLDNGKLLEAENHLYFARKEAIQYRTKSLKLSLKLEEIQNKDKENVYRPPREEMIPGFVKPEEHKQECHKTSDTSVKSETSQPSQVLCSTSAKLNENSVKRDGEGCGSNDCSAADCKEHNISGPRNLANTRKTFQRVDLSNDSTCIQQ